MSLQNFSVDAFRAEAFLNEFRSINSQLIETDGRRISLKPEWGEDLLWASSGLSTALTSPTAEKPYFFEVNFTPNAAETVDYDYVVDERGKNHFRLHLYRAPPVAGRIGEIIRPVGLLFLCAQAWVRDTKENRPKIRLHSSTPEEALFYRAVTATSAQRASVMRRIHN